MDVVAPMDGKEHRFSGKTRPKTLVVCSPVFLDVLCIQTHRIGLLHQTSSSLNSTMQLCSRRRHAQDDSTTHRHTTQINISGKVCIHHRVTTMGHAISPSHRPHSKDLTPPSGIMTVEVALGFTQLNKKSSPGTQLN